MPNFTLTRTTSRTARPTRASSNASAPKDFTTRMLRMDSCRRAASSAKAENWSVASRRMGPRRRRTAPKWSTAAPQSGHDQLWTRAHHQPAEEGDEQRRGKDRAHDRLKPVRGRARVGLEARDELSRAMGSEESHREPEEVLEQIEL